MAKYRSDWTCIVFSRGHRSKFIWSCFIYVINKRITVHSEFIKVALKMKLCTLLYSCHSTFYLMFIESLIVSFSFYQTFLECIELCILQGKFLLLRCFASTVGNCRILQNVIQYQFFQDFVFN